MEFIPQNQVQWKTVKYLRQGETRNYDYTFILPEPLASWDVWDYWERERVESMRKNLQPGMVLYDIGTEQGWCNLAYAKMVKPENVLLVEPTQVFWPNIRATWEKNFGDKMPLATFSGLMSNDIRNGDNGVYSQGWPTVSDGPLVDRNAYTYIHNNIDNISQSTIDHAAKIFTPPDAITMDIEGAEMLALAGADSVLEHYKPLVWVSIHPDMMIRDYGFHAEDLRAYMRMHGYAEHLLATDHEQHWFFYPQNRAVEL